MIKPEQIPEAVVYEVFKGCEWDTEREAAEAIAAALNAWPGMKACEEDDLGPACLILPLTEKQDDA